MSALTAPTEQGGITTGLVEDSQMTSNEVQNGLGAGPNAVIIIVSYILRLQLRLDKVGQFLENNGIGFDKMRFDKMNGNMYNAASEHANQVMSDEKNIKWCQKLVIFLRGGQ